MRREPMIAGASNVEMAVISPFAAKSVCQGKSAPPASASTSSVETL